LPSEQVRKIEQQELRIGDQRTGDRQHPLLPAGQQAGGLSAALSEARKQGVEAIFRPEGVTATACEGGGDGKVLRDGEIAEQTPVLRSPGNSGYGAPIGRRRSQIVPLKPQMAGGERNCAHDRTDRRGFAGTVSPK
jgi:hypothetical protein